MKQVITANTLKTGEVVFRGKDGWVSNIDDATLYDQSADLDQDMERYLVPHHVLGVYSIMVNIDGKTVTPHHIREKIRATGPGNYDHKRDGDTSSMGNPSAKPSTK